MGIKRRGSNLTRFAMVLAQMRKSLRYYITLGEWGGFKAGKLLELIYVLISSGITNVIQHHHHCRRYFV